MPDAMLRIGQRRDVAEAALLSLRLAMEGCFLRERRLDEFGYAVERNLAVDA